MTTITALTDLSKLPNQSQDQAVFDANWAYVLERLPERAQQENALAANLNSIAAGGAYAIPFTFDTGTAYADPGAGKIRLSNSTTVESATGLYASNTSSAGLAVAALLASVAGSTSFIKGHFRLISVTNPSKYVIFSVTTVDTTPGTYRAFGIQFVSTPGASFANGEAVVLHFQRTGDKGDASTLTPVLWVRDEKASGVVGGSGIPDGYVVRTLNTAKKNSMSGASLAGNQITLPAGTFRVSFTAPAGPIASNHKAYLYNVTDGVTTVAGTSTYAPQSAQIVTVSQVLCAEFTISSSKVFEVRHWIAAAGTPNLGAASSSGQVEVYTDVFIEKVS